MAGLSDILGYLLNTGQGLPPMGYVPNSHINALFDPNYVPNRHINALFTLPSWYRQSRLDEGFSTPPQIDPRAYDFTGEQGLATYNTTGNIWSKEGQGVVTPGFRDRTTTLPYKK